MKIQCSCGTKYAFDITPDMLANPIRFVCQNCGADNSDGVNAVIRQQFASVPVEPAAVTSPAAPDEPANEPKRLRVTVTAHAAHAATPPSADNLSRPCPKHPGQVFTEQCVVCRKPMCPKCMELFGYVCSPFCKSEAESRGIHVPTFAGQSSAVQAKSWNKFRFASLGIVGGIAVMAGLWSWYEFKLSRPHVVFSVAFPKPSFSGGAKFVTGSDAIVLHGGRLARYDLKQKKEVWAAEPIDKKAIAETAAKEAVEEAKSLEAFKKRLLEEAGEELKQRPRSAAEIAESMEHAAAEEMRLYLNKKNVWLRQDGKLVRYDWDSGKPAQEIAVQRNFHEVIENGSSLLFLGWSMNGREAVRVDLASGTSQNERLEDNSAAARIAAETQALIATNAKAASAALIRTAGTQPGVRGTPTNKLAGFKLKAQPTFAEQIAAPAIVATKIRNEQIDEATREERVRARSIDDLSGSRLVNAGSNLVVVSTKMLEEKFNQRQAMKAAPKKAALDNPNLSVTATLDVANEMMNDFQRERTGGVEIEDVSRYEVSLKRPGTEIPEWKGEVIGPPEFFALKHVDLLVAGKSITVFDKQNKKLWQATLSFDIAHHFSVDRFDDDADERGGPAVEHGSRLFFHDRGMLTCFETATGNVFWRLQSVGVSKVLFDAKDNLYVETTTDSADSLKFSQQVDVSKKVHPLILKVDPEKGKILWRSEDNGRLAYVSGNILYTLEWMGGDEDEERHPLSIGLEIPPHVRVRRLSLRSGKPLWTHYQKRAPVDVKFDGNTIQLVFKKELQVLKYFSL